MIFRPLAVPRPGSLPRRINYVPAAATRLSSSATSSSPVSLAFEVHDPPRPVAARETSPILFLHGLFGSKKNNRGISK